MKRKVENKGFTLIELLVTVAILGILAAVLVPSYVQYISSTKAKVCEVNRLQFVHSFKVYKVYDGGNYSLADAVSGGVAALSAEKAGLKCPSGGEITAASSGTTASINCKLHGSLTVDMSDIGGGTGNGDGGGGTTNPPDKYPGTEIVIQANYWPEQSQWGSGDDVWRKIEIPAAGIFKYSDGNYYIVSKSYSVNKSQAFNGPAGLLNEYNTHKITGRILVPSEFKDNNSNQKTDLSRGDICLENKSYYVFIDGGSTAALPSKSPKQWYKIP